MRSYVACKSNVGERDATVGNVRVADGRRRVAVSGGMRSIRIEHQRMDVENQRFPKLKRVRIFHGGK